MSAKVSIVIPVYNVEKYLRQCMDSIVSQTLKDIEIICIDDGATDHSGAILDEYAAKDDRVKVFHRKNGGYGVAMNAGLREATGDYIGIVEPDDFIEPDTYDTLYNKAVETGVDFVKANVWAFFNDCSYVIKTFKEGGPYDRVVTQEEYLPFYTDMGCRIWSFIYRSDFLKKNGINFLETPGASYQDTSFWLKVMFDAKSGYFFERAFYHYRSDNPSSSIHQDTKILNVVTELHEVERKYKDRPEILKLVNTIKFDKYCWNYQRLGKEGRKVFWPVFKKEIGDILRDHSYDERYFNAATEVENCREIIEKHRSHLVRKLISLKKKLSYLVKSFSVKGKESFFSAGYKCLHPECTRGGLSPWQHYVLEGMENGYGDGNTPTDGVFFREGYELEYPDVKAAGIDAWHHYAEKGKEEKRDNGLHPDGSLFFAEGYLEMYPDAAKTKADAWRHYVLKGKAEGRDNGLHPDKKIFSAEGYLKMYPDVAEAKADPWHDYVLKGKAAGRGNGLGKK